MNEAPDRKRICPDCKGRGAGRGSKPYVPGLPCDRCEGAKTVPDLGRCCAVDVIDAGRVTEDQEMVLFFGGPLSIAELAGRHCGEHADRVYAGLPLCDGHTLEKAVNMGKGCPNCAGDLTRGMHRGTIVGSGKVMTCSSTAAQRALQEASDKACGGFGKTFEQMRESFECLPPSDEEAEEDPGESCLTDSERNPSMGIHDPQDYD